MHRSQLLSYYRQYLREASHIHHYSFREYAKRKIRNDFRSTSIIPDETHISTEFDRLKRIRVLSKMYCENNHILN